MPSAAPPAAGHRSAGSALRSDFVNYVEDIACPCYGGRSAASAEHSPEVPCLPCCSQGAGFGSPRGSHRLLLGGDCASEGGSANRSAVLGW